MATPYEKKFKDVLAEILQLDQADLDFGIYRIMNQKRKDIDVFLNTRLIPEVTTILKTNATAFADISAMENEVFSHLTKFFSRYYEGGDFISKRRYKDDAYAIPYNGEEVKLYWANADQYYIKTSEYFKNYAFVLPTSRRKVHFLLRDAETEQNNNKAANNMERRFQLCKEHFIDVSGDELNIYFTYELMPKATKQDALLKDAESRLQPAIDERFADFTEMTASGGAPTKSDRNRTLLMKHLQDYTAKNNFDYFIHKDLGGFLRRELDFYIKNEVMFLDDLDADHIMEHLAQVKAIKQVGEKIITFLAQLEDFQKKLWLKKKFVIGCDYCITLDRIPRALYPAIVANEAQREKWVRLFAIDEIKGDMITEGYSEPLSEKFLEENPFLVLDTKFFDAEFKHKVVESMENVDEECNGLLINSENFQALELLQEKYREAIKCVYIDPPYNTGSDGFIYKDSYQHSGWLSMLENRYSLMKALLNITGGVFTSIDDGEHERLVCLQNTIFGSDNFVDNIIWQKKYSLQSDAKLFSDNHDFISCFAKYKESFTLNLLPRSEEQNKYYKYDDNDGRGLWRSDNVLVRSFSQSGVFPIVNPNTGVAYFPPKGSCYRFSKETAERYLKENRFYFGKDGKGAPQLKRYLSEVKQGVTPVTIWLRDEVGDTQEGANILSDLFGGKVFTSPKVPRLIYRIVQLSSNKNSIVLDYFAGSGTTGHAVINLNRDDNGNRKYILCEMGNYFNSVTKPRIEKVIYSEDWKDGKPVSRNGISQCFKYLRLEQYEDTLNNLQPKQTGLEFKDGKASFEENYLLRYMLDTEAKGDLFNMEWFVHPFDITLKTTKDNELIETPVDMVETFNYLIGLNVKTMRWPKEGYCVVEGVTHIGGERTLVIWRDCEKVSNEALNEFFRKQANGAAGSEFDKIYVNGDNTLPNIKTDEEHWKVVLIEAEFKKRMFGN